MSQSTAGYSRVQIGLHWVVAGLILANWWFSDGMGDALDAHIAGDAPVNVGLATWHVWAGVTIFALVALRLILRWVQGVPSSDTGHGWADRAARWGHGLLYLLMLAVPLGGMITWFLKIDAVGQAHALAANALMIVALAHALVALFHQYVLKDHLLERMTHAR